MQGILLPRMAQLVLALILGLAILTWVASGVVETTARGWFERDVGDRSRLVLVSAGPSLAGAWSNQSSLGQHLAELARDERVMGAAACGLDLQPRAATPGFPTDFGCWAIGARLRSGGAGSSIREWSTVADPPSGRIHVSVMPVSSEAGQLGFSILLHDLSYIQIREEKARSFLLAAFCLLALLALLLPVFAARWARYGWNTELRTFLRGGGRGGKREFQPLLKDVRELVERMAHERDDVPGQWTARRLKQALNRHLHGERVVIVSNREPYLHERTQGGIEVRHPASGLVTALEPVMTACSGVWVAHGAGSADRETVDANGRVRVPPGEESYHIRRVWLSEEQESGYYYGFANEGLWPLCHIAHTRPTFRAEDWRQYQAVNRLFANAVCEEVDSEDPIILVQDYHLALVPALIRERLPAATVIMFWHVPWPNAERMGICPWRDELIEGLLGSSILGFHTQLHCNNLIDSADRYLETRIDREHNAVAKSGHRTLVRPYPISLEWPVKWAEAAASPRDCREQVWHELGLKPGALLGVGVDRLDYTKGVEERLLAVELLLETHPEYRGRFTFVQLAAPSRTKIERYRQLNDAVEKVAARVNERFGAEGYRPIVLLRAHHEPAEVYRYYRASDVCYVSSLHDGMNLVAKEFVASRNDLRGVLVLSEFTGAARELTEALIVNPYNLEAAAGALAEALRMPPGEQADRMLAMRSVLAQFNVYRWAGTMLADAARLRSQERLSSRLSARQPAMV
ncbi:MAG: trehalose-6-phosphate synthase [Acidobacteria bacterium]|nr:trehalose-6-phosphate synthase [Acidobacteriota bacterium]